MKIERTKLPGVVVFTPDRYSDKRGFFAETANQHYNFTPKQSNMSSSKRGVVRGLHIQPNTAKLVWVAEGSIYDVAYDAETDDYVGVELSAENGKQLLVPAGYHHGFQALEEGTVVCYLMDEYYDPKGESGLHPYRIDWPIKEAIVSEKDAKAP